MKPEEKKRAIDLRKRGLSINEIADAVGVSKGSVSLWTRNIELSAEQKLRLCGNSKSGLILATEASKRAREDRDRLAKIEADNRWPLLCENPFFMFGLALYVGEGDKSTRACVGLSNCDVRVLKKFIDWMKLIGVEKEHLRCHINIHDNCLVQNAESFWSVGLGLYPKQFCKTTVAVSSSSKRLKGNVQENGTATVRHGNTFLKQMLNRWMDLSLSSIG